MFRKQGFSFNGKSSVRERSFLPLPLGFFAQSQSAASVGSSAAVQVSGSPAGRNLSHVPGPQLVPEHQDKHRMERNRHIKNMKILSQINKIDYRLALLAKAS